MCADELTLMQADHKRFPLENLEIDENE